MALGCYERSDDTQIEANCYAANVGYELATVLLRASK